MRSTARRARAATELVAARELRDGADGEDVRRLQQALTAVGMPAGRIDASFGPLTKAGVRRFQETAALRVDGVVGDLTWQALLHPVASGRAELFLHLDPKDPLRRHLAPDHHPGDGLGDA